MPLQSMKIYAMKNSPDYLSIPTFISKNKILYSQYQIQFCVLYNGASYMQISNKDVAVGGREIIGYLNQLVNNMMFKAREPSYTDLMASEAIRPIGADGKIIDDEDDYDIRYDIEGYQRKRDGIIADFSESAITKEEISMKSSKMERQRNSRTDQKIKSIPTLQHKPTEIDDAAEAKYTEGGNINDGEYIWEEYINQEADSRGPRVHRNNRRVMQLP